MTCDSLLFNFVNLNKLQHINLSIKYGRVLNDLLIIMFVCLICALWDIVGKVCYKTFLWYNRPLNLFVFLFSIELSYLIICFNKLQ